MFTNLRLIWQLGTLVGIGFILLFLGSAGVFNDPIESVDLVKPGMTADEVIDILGAPTRATDNPLSQEGQLTQYEMVWRSGNKEVRVVIVNDRVYGRPSKRGFGSAGK